MRVSVFFLTSGPSDAHVPVVRRVPPVEGAWLNSGKPETPRKSKKLGSDVSFTIFIFGKIGVWPLWHLFSNYSSL